MYGFGLMIINWFEKYSGFLKIALPPAQYQPCLIEYVSRSLTKGNQMTMSMFGNV